MIRSFLILAGSLFTFSPLAAQAFNGNGELQTSQLGYYYVMGGGLFPNGQTRTAAGPGAQGTMAFITDDPIWGQPLNTWQSDTWFNVTSGVALTLRNNSNAVVYDNNGVETGNVPTGFWNSTQVPGSQVMGYSMVDNFDWTYAGFLTLSATTEIKSLTGYFVAPTPGFFGGGDPTGLFNPNLAHFNMEIWSDSAVTGGTRPTNTGSFDGDVFSSTNTPGSFSFSDTGFDRVSAAGTLDIFRLTYTLDTPISLAAGDYWFSHQALVAVPEPASIAMTAGAVLAAGSAWYWRRRRLLKAADAEVQTA